MHPSCLFSQPNHFWMSALDEINIPSLKLLFALQVEDLLNINGFQFETAHDLSEPIHAVKKKLTLDVVMHCSNIMGRGIGLKTIRNMD